MGNWYTSRERVKRAANINGTESNAQIDRIIEASSRDIDQSTRRRFIPITATKTFGYPRIMPLPSWVLWLREDLLSITTLQTKAQNTTPTTISSSDYFLEPNNYGPPYDRIEIDQSSSAAWESGDTAQRSISIAGSWGYNSETKSSGTVASGLDSDSTATTMVCSDSFKIGVGDTLLIESEQIFVSDKTSAALGSILLNGALTATKSQVTVTVDGSHGIVAGEVLLVESERIFVESVSTNDLTVIRGYDGSILAAHNDDSAVHIFRTLTIERGANGTTAATHADATAISAYKIPQDIESHCLAESLAMYFQEEAGFGRSVGAGDGAIEFTARDLASRRMHIERYYRKARTGVI
jgi:hypothetical protein